MSAPLCSISDLRVTLPGPLEIVCGVSLELFAGQTTALVGESGSGKSMTGLGLMQLLPTKARTSGSVRLGEDELLQQSESAWRRTRGNRVAVVFQEPMTALNPVLPIAQQVGEPLRIHQNASVATARAQAIDMLRRVGLPAPERVADQYPHQLSGGMRQRVVIAMALICRPQVLIADEPTTALDATTQLQILELLGDLQQEFGMAVLLITHDLTLVRQRADRVAIMYAGRLVEQGPAEAILNQPAHPYTQALLQVAPDLDRPSGGRLPVIGGDVPQPGNRPSGCAFHPRCEIGRDEARCRQEPPGTSEGSHRWACWHPQIPA